MFNNGFTYAAHPVCCAVALKNIEIIERENLLEHVRRVTPQFQARLSDLGRHPLVGDTRGVGLIGCVEGRAGASKSLEADSHFGEILDAACEKRGLIVRPIINMAVFSPPLIISPAEIDEMFDILAAALDDVARAL